MGVIVSLAIALAEVLIRDAIGVGTGLLQKREISSVFFLLLKRMGEKSANRKTLRPTVAG